MTTQCPPPSAGNLSNDQPYRRGDHLRAGNPGSPHHDGIYLGDDLVIHLTGGEGGGKANARVRIDTLALFASGRPVTVRPYAEHHDPDAIIARAMSKLGEGGYHLIFNNCQHFARWCATGDHHSEQVTSAAATTGTVGVPVITAVVGFNVVGSAGLVTGLSGPGIMSGLAAYGALVGGGAVAGLVVLGSAPSLATIVIMNKALHEDDDLPQPERDARTTGRVGTVAGALAGSIGSVAAVSALGVPGLSAVGISSGLATIGGAVGGGMAAGAISVIAAPAVAAAIAGYLAYRFARWLTTPEPNPAPAQ
ncbi:MAG TPA: lecithin retinol acyltransferase family protein [Streptosporangiaceae bacterium]|nr:lecithin retinol acyltransferase family protein [Streptosporangiaceae bacterium]